MNAVIIPYEQQLLLKGFKKDDESCLFDVGCGDQSPSMAKRNSPNCHYYRPNGDKYYNNDEADFVAMEDFYETDLTELKFDII